MSNSKAYFSYGQTKIPADVMKQIQEEFTNYRGMNVGIIQMNNSFPILDVSKKVESNLRSLLAIPDYYEVLFLDGPPENQFKLIPMNLCPELNRHNVDYIVTGTLSELAANEAEKHPVTVKTQRGVGKKRFKIPSQDALENVEEATYRFYCDDEVFQGVEFSYIPECQSYTYLVCNMSSNFLTRPVDVKKFGLIFAGLHENCGIPAMTVVIIRKDLVGMEMSVTPNNQKYKELLKGGSSSNAPSIFNLYVADLYFKWILDKGGLVEMEKLIMQKSKLIYDVIDNSEHFYQCPMEKKDRSRVNITFFLQYPSYEVNFIEESRASNLFGLVGHKSVGGFRVSLHHNVSLEDTKRLADFMDDFKQMARDMRRIKDVKIYEK